MNDKCVLSIGLNVGSTEPERQLEDTLRRVSATFGPVLAVAMGRSERNGVPERFVQVAVQAAPDNTALRTPGLCRALHQDAIAVIRPGSAVWTLHGADGGIEQGGGVAEFPVILEVPK